MKEIIICLFSRPEYYFAFSFVMFLILSFFIGLCEKELDNWLDNKYEDYDSEEFPTIGKMIIIAVFCLSWPLVISLIAFSLPYLLGTWIKNRINNVKNMKKFKL